MHVDAVDLDAGQRAGAAKTARAREIGMPNLFSDLAGRDLGVGARVDVRVDADGDRRARPLAAATSERASSSGSDSTLKQRMPSSIPSAISARVLPTPEKMILSAGTPAARARRSSPSETTSMPAPSRASVVSTAWLELAFIA